MRKLNPSTLGFPISPPSASSSGATAPAATKTDATTQTDGFDGSGSTPPLSAKETADFNRWAAAKKARSQARHELDFGIVNGVFDKLGVLGIPLLPVAGPARYLSAQTKLAAAKFTLATSPEPSLRALIKHQSESRMGSNLAREELAKRPVSEAVPAILDPKNMGLVAPSQRAATGELLAEFWMHNPSQRDTILNAVADSPYPGVRRGMALELRRNAYSNRSQGPLTTQADVDRANQAYQLLKVVNSG